MLCALSGEITRDPVVSTKSGHVFERQLLAKYIERNPEDPVSHEPMTMDDIVPIRSVNPVVRPRPNANSLPALMNSFQDEWDALMLETYTLRQNLHATRKELSHSLYRYDAAVRVIARLKSERDEARSGLAQATSQVGMEIDRDEKPESFLPEDVVANLDENCKLLTSTRRSTFKNPSERLASVDQLATYIGERSFALHLSSKPGITCVDAHKTVKELIATGGVDTRVVVFDIDSGKVKDTLKGHTKKVTSLVFHSERQLLASASEDGTVRLWESSGKSFQSAYSLSDHSDIVTSVDMHSSRRYMGSASRDRSWAFYDLEEGKLIHQFVHAPITSGYSAGVFHPDGVLYAGGAGDVIFIWDLKAQAPVTSFEGHAGDITSLSFSENGFYMAAADTTGTTKIWDLRKLQAVYELPKQDVVNAVRFDPSGHYLAVAGSTLQVYEVAKKWPTIVSWDNRSMPCTDVVFGADASFVASVGMDRHLNLYTSP